MRFKSELKIFILYNIIIIGVFIVLEKYGISSFIKYISFETQTFKFQDLLSISLTVLSILVGAMLTIATVLISMCDKRVIKLINRFNKAHFVISTIKRGIVEGFITVGLLSIVYAKIDYNILWIRLMLLYISTFTLTLFIQNGMILIRLTLRILEESFEETSKSEVTFKNKG